MKLSRRTVTGLLGLGLLVAAISLFVSIPSAQGRRMAPRRLDRAAEWGVWKTRAGQITSLDELAAELPSFVHRGRPSAASHSQTSAPPPHMYVRPAHARKPVLYLYSSRSLRVRVRVGLPVGGETLHYPAASAGGGGLLFSGRVTATDTGRSARLRHAPRGHFWNALRQVPASVFTTDSGEAERFIFYDGLTNLRTPFQFYGAGDHASVAIRRGRHGDPNLTDTVFAVHGGMFHRVVPAGTNPTRLSSGDERPISTLEGELRAQLTARGLTVQEAQSLLTTWHHDLFEASGDRRIYFIDRADYDAMLPLNITPRPRQIVRVGLVIEL